MTDKTFLGVSDAMLKHLDDLSHDKERGAWWRDVLLSDDLFIAIRDGYLNVYHRGASLYRIDEKGGGTPHPKTHVKYLVRHQQELAELVDGKFVSAKEIAWTSYEPGKTLHDMIYAASALAGEEKEGLHSMIMHEPRVIDVELALGSNDRLDAVTLEPEGDSIAIAFHEAKHFDNPALRQRTKGNPNVIEQLRRYRRTLEDHKDLLLERYRVTCRALVKIAAMRRQVRDEYNLPTDELSPLIQNAAAGTAKLVINCDPRLIIFGFDSDQKSGALKRMKEALTNAEAEPGLSIYAAGDPKTAKGAFNPPAG